MRVYIEEVSAAVLVIVRDSLGNIVMTFKPTSLFNDCVSGASLSVGFDPAIVGRTPFFVKTQINLAATGENGQCIVGAVLVSAPLIILGKPIDRFLVGDVISIDCIG